MKKRLLPILLIAGAVAMAGCQGPAPPAPLVPGARYPQRDLTAPWPERHYWQVPPSGLPATPAAADENAGRAPDALPAARPTQPAPRTRLGRRLGRGPRTVCAKQGC